METSQLNEKSDIVEDTSPDKFVLAPVNINFEEEANKNTTDVSVIAKMELSTYEVEMKEKNEKHAEKIRSKILSRKNSSYNDKSNSQSIDANKKPQSLYLRALAPSKKYTRPQFPVASNSSSIFQLSSHAKEATRRISSNESSAPFLGLTNDDSISSNNNFGNDLASSPPKYSYTSSFFGLNGITDRIVSMFTGESAAVIYFHFLLYCLCYFKLKFLL